jgi:N-acetylglutamate synthase-like GNAT family acetyltransferase
VRIRAVRNGDVAAVTRLLVQLGYPADEERVARRLERLEQSPADGLFVAEVDGEVVGLAGIHVSPSLSTTRTPPR